MCVSFLMRKPEKKNRSMNENNFPTIPRVKIFSSVSFMLYILYFRLTYSRLVYSEVSLFIFNETLSFAKFYLTSAPVLWNNEAETTRLCFKCWLKKIPARKVNATLINLGENNNALHQTSLLFNYKTWMLFFSSSVFNSVIIVSL